MSTGPALLSSVKETASRLMAGVVTGASSIGEGVRLTNALLRGGIKAAAAFLLFAGPVQAGDEPLRIMVLGDSLAAGYGLLPADSFTQQLQNWADEEAAAPLSIENAGVSGDTTAGGLARLDWALGSDMPDAVIVELGGNDALRGIEPEETQANLDKILEKLAERNIAALLAGMLAPRNMGEDYVTAFEAVYPALAEKHDVVYLPFFLEGVAGQRELNQPDGIHPNPEGVTIVVAHIAPKMQELVERLVEADTE